MKPYEGTYDKAKTLSIVKMERRLELAMECERFFDLVRWGEAASLFNDSAATESKSAKFLEGAQFVADKERIPACASRADGCLLMESTLRTVVIGNKNI